MDILLDEIEKALDEEMYLVALQATLALPDICGALEAENGKATNATYLAWFNQYGSKHIYSKNMTAEDCYLFRCSILHQGSTIPAPREHQTAQFSRILFFVDNTNVYNDNIINGALNIDIDVFCRGIIEGVREWQTTMEQTGNTNYQKNYCRMIRAYYDGLAPYTHGVYTIT